MSNSVIGALSVKITGDAAELKRALKETSGSLDAVSKKARQTANAFGKMGVALGAAAAAASAAIVSANLKTIDSLAKTADKLGLTTEALQGLRHAAELTGVSSQTMDMAMQRMTRRVSEAAQGTGEAVKAIDELGLSAESLAQLSPDQQMLKIAGAMEQVTSQGDRVRLAMKLFDSEGVSLVNTLAAGEEGLRGMINEVDELGAAISRFDAAKIEQANDAFTRGTLAASAFGTQLTVEVAPTLTAVVDLLTETSDGASILGVTAQNVFSGATKVVSVFADGLRGIHVIIKALEVGLFGFSSIMSSTMKDIMGGIDTAIDFALESINKLIAVANTIPGIDIEQFVTGDKSAVTQFFTDIADEATSKMREAQAELKDLSLQPLPSEVIDEFIQNANTLADERAKATAKAIEQKQQEKTALDEIENQGGTAVDRYQAETVGLLEAMGMRFTSVEEMQLAQNAREMELLQQQYDNKLIKEAEFQDKKTKIERTNQELQRKMLVSSLQQGFEALRSNSKKVDKAMKAAAVVQAVIKGKQAAVDAWQAGMSTGGPWAPAVAAAYTAASIARTASMISSINSGGKSMSGMSGGGGIPSAGGGSSAAAPQAPTQEPQADRNVTINLTGDSMYSTDQVRNLIEQINGQVGDGLTLNTGT
jgi:hypothetical protein